MAATIEGIAVDLSDLDLDKKEEQITVHQLTRYVRWVKRYAPLDGECQPHQIEAEWCKKPATPACRSDDRLGTLNTAVEGV
jgi:hypothetical protein